MKCHLVKLHILPKLNVGTPLYMAPEVSTDLHYNDKVDVFSYSILFYELLTLRKPYSDRKDIDISNIVSFVSKGERPTKKRMKFLLFLKIFWIRVGMLIQMKDHHLLKSLNNSLTIKMNSLTWIKMIKQNLKIISKWQPIIWNFKCKNKIKS